MASSFRPQVVIDTNVWISAIVFGGNPEKIVRLFTEGQVVVVVAEEFLSELRHKIIKRFPLFSTNLDLLEASIREDALMVRLGTIKITDSRDKKDNMFLEAAVTAKAEYIISGDNDLLVLDPYKEIRILKPADFLKIIDN